MTTVNKIVMVIWIALCRRENDNTDYTSHFLAINCTSLLDYRTGRGSPDVLPSPTHGPEPVAHVPMTLMSAGSTSVDPLPSSIDFNREV
jgi:hypothetical protein